MAKDKETEKRRAYYKSLPEDTVTCERCRIHGWLHDCPDCLGTMTIAAQKNEVIDGKG